MNSKTNKGITLIALVITIIVLLTLAGVTINMVLGDDGIIKQAQQAKELNKDAAIKEEIRLIAVEVEMAKHGLGDIKWLDKESDKGKTRAENIIARLEEKNIVADGELVPVEIKTTDEVQPQAIRYAEKETGPEFLLTGIVGWYNDDADLLYIDNGVLMGPAEGLRMSDFTEIVIPDSVTSIGYCAFERFCKSNKYNNTR